jgi:D-arabinose 1-dehydrogenase-like Zn-dependent alcohol dehydrogenase
MASMRAIVLDGPGPPSALAIRERPIPVPAPGWVLIRVRAFGLNRSELHTRLGLAEGVTFPRVLGIEAAGEAAQCPGGEFAPGQQVATMMGGMGRTFDGGYADYTCVPAGQVIPFHSDLDWATLGAVPEMLQTAYGSLTVGLDGRPGQSILIRGGTSSVGMATAVLARQRDMTVLATTRNPGKAAALTAIGADHVLIDDGAVANQVRDVLGDGADTALELVGTHAARHPERGAGARNGLLHRDAVQPVDDQGLLPDRLPAQRCPPHRLRRHRRRPARRDPAGLPRRRGGRPGPGPCRPRLPVRPDRRGPRGHGSQPGHRQTGRPHRAPAWQSWTSPGGRHT